MKKFLLFSIVCVCFCSCKSSFDIVKENRYNSKEEKMWKKTELTYCYGKKFPFVLDNETIFIPCKINDTEHLLLYNGTSSSGFIEKVPINAKFPKSHKTVKVRSSLLKQAPIIKKGLNYYNIESDFFNFKHYVGRIYAKPNEAFVSKCTQENNQNNFHLCRDHFPKWKNGMLLNFSDTTITLLDSNDTYDTTGFMFIKSRFTCMDIELWLSVDSAEYRFNFSTISKEFLCLPYYEHRAVWLNKHEYIFNHHPLYEKHKKENDVFIMSVSGKNAIDTFVIQQTNSIIMGNLDSINGTILYKKDLIEPIMGMQFITQFDWIIDRNKLKVYAKPIKEIECNDVFSNHYRVDVFDTTLQISALPVGETKYQLFSIIYSVNGEKVNADNICQMRELLNKKNGFIDNKIVILP